MSPWKQKSSNAAGVFVITPMFGAEVATLDHVDPHAATPWIPALLIAIAAGAPAAALRWHRKAMHSPD